MNKIFELMMKRKSVSQLGAVQLEGTINNNQDIIVESRGETSKCSFYGSKGGGDQTTEACQLLFYSAGFYFQIIQYIFDRIPLIEIGVFPFVKKLGRYHLANYIERNTYSIPGIDVGDIHEGIVIRQRFPSVDEFHLKSNQNRTSRIRN